MWRVAQRLRRIGSETKLGITIQYVSCDCSDYLQFKKKGDREWRFLDFVGG